MSDGIASTESTLDKHSPGGWCTFSGGSITVKTSNDIVDTEGRLEKLSPSCICELSDGSTTVIMSDEIVGTEGYQAPELLAGKQYTSKVDIYSLGMTLSNLVRDAGIDDCQTLTESVQHMTNTNPSERWTASLALGHAFFSIVPNH
jgi:hypothetical protein